MSEVSNQSIVSRIVAAIKKREHNNAWDLIEENRQVLSEADVLYFEGIILCNTGREKQALPRFERLVEMPTLEYSRKNQVQMILGYYHTRMEEYDKAIKYFRDVIEYDFNCSQAHCGLGFSYSALRKYDEAIMAYQTAIQVDPLNPVAHHSLGYLLAESGRDLVRAVAECEEAVRLGDESAPTLDSLAWVLYLSGNIPLAREMIVRALGKDPGNRTIKKHYTIIMNTGNKEEELEPEEVKS